MHIGKIRQISPRRHDVFQGNPFWNLISATFAIILMIVGMVNQSPTPLLGGIWLLVTALIFYVFKSRGYPWPLTLFFSVLLAGCLLGIRPFIHKPADNSLTPRDQNPQRSGENNKPPIKPPKGHKVKPQGQASTGMKADDSVGGCYQGTDAGDESGPADTQTEPSVVPAPASLSPVVQDSIYKAAHLNNPADANIQIYYLDSMAIVAIQIRDAVTKNNVANVNTFTRLTNRAACPQSGVKFGNVHRDNLPLARALLAEFRHAGLVPDAYRLPAVPTEDASQEEGVSAYSLDVFLCGAATAGA